MKYVTYIERVATALGARLPQIAPDGVQAFADPKYLNLTLLKNLTDEEIDASIRVVVTDIDLKFGEELRREGAPVEAAHVHSVLKERFCSLPPFCN